MTESTAIHILGCIQEDFTSCAPPEFPEPDSALRLQIIVAELLTAVRSLLQGDRDSAEVSVDRITEMMDGGGVSKIAAPVVGYSKSDRILPNVRGGLAPWQVRRVTAHIESHLGGPITTQDLATIAKVSTYHFTRAFRESLSETPHEYVMRRRVERAQGLMLTTNMALGRIAIDCGFADQAHFNKLFRRLAGESPGVWRRARVTPPLGGDIHASPIKLGVCK
jgi:AraC-like DNA-binding protein